eukprot:gene7374-13115_t
MANDSELANYDGEWMANWRIGWRMDGELRMANYGWRITDGELRMANYGWRITDGELRMANYGWRITDGELANRWRIRWRITMANIVTPIWTLIPEASQACHELVKCGFKGNCSPRCKCKRYGPECTELCQCGYLGKFLPEGNKLCDLPGYNSGDVICWKRFDGCTYAFHKRCLTNEDVCPICQTFLKKELERLAKIAKNAVLSQEVRDDINDNISNETNKEVDDDPCVEDITKAEVINKIGELTEELYSLSPPSYLISEGLSSSDCTSSNDNRCPHCRICQHEMKGHKKISDDKSTVQFAQEVFVLLQDFAFHVLVIFIHPSRK